MFSVGFLASLIGNCIIGAGQCLQKYAINRLEMEKKQSLLASKHWILGIIMTYVGELFGNWVGLSLASIALIAPLGIISLLVNATLASLYLGEKFNKEQKEGYGFIIAGVFLILLVSPKKEGLVVLSLKTVKNWLEFLNGSSFLPSLLVLFCGALVVMYLVISSRKKQIYYFVVAVALCATITVLTSKTISLYFKVYMGSTTVTKVDPNATRFALFVLYCTLIFSIISQEIFRQQAYSHFKVSHFQPLLYSSFNVFSVIFSEIVFQELDKSIYTYFVFYSAFLSGIILISKGSALIQSNEQESLQKAS